MLLEEPLPCDELARHVIGMRASRGDAGRCVRLTQQNADLRTLERGHRILRVIRRNVVERVSGLIQAVCGQIQDAQLEMMTERGTGIPLLVRQFQFVREKSPEAAAKRVAEAVMQTA